LLPTDVQSVQVNTARGAFSVAFELLRPVLNEGLLLSGTAIAAAAEGLDFAANVPADASDLADALAEDLNSEIAALGLNLPPELTVTDIEMAIVDALDTSALRGWMEAYVEARRAELDAQAERDRLADDEARKSAEALAARNAQRRHVGQATPQVEIHSPVPVDPVKGFVYPNAVPVHVTIEGARAAYLEPGSPERTMVRVNGAEIPRDALDWRFDDDAEALVLSGLLTSGLRHGLNVIEVTIADGIAAPVRGKVSFLANPDLAPRGEGLRIAPELSQFDAPGNDHQALLEEFVVLQNTSDDPIELAGLRIADLAGHVYVFEPRTLQPGALVRLRTGTGADTLTDVHWGRGAAVWNNRGDRIDVYDADRVLWAQHVYPGA
jgi:hypothetical protein